MSTLSTVIQHCVEFLARTIRQEKERKEIQIGKEEIKLCLIVDDMTPYLKNPKDSTLKHVELIHNWSKVAGYKINFPKKRKSSFPIGQQ
jgi:hypothetical protein